MITLKWGGTISSQWLRKWGLDLQRFTNDRMTRNAASYRPTRLDPRPPVSSLDSSRSMRDIWAVCEPSLANGFTGLDRYLIRRSLELAYTSTSVPAKRTAQDFASRIAHAVSQLGPIGLSSQQWQDFLTRQTDPADPPLLTRAEGISPIAASTHHLEVLARATLLLRIATGTCLQMLRNTGVTGADLNFWWGAIAHDHGLWEQGDQPVPLSNLWLDIAGAMEDLESWEQNAAVTGMSVAEWRRDCASALSILSSCELLGLWGLGL